MPAIAIAGIAAASSIAGGAIGSKGASNAAETAAQGQIDAAKISAQSQEKMYNQTRGDQLPFLAGGSAALGRLDYELGLPSLQASTQAGYKAGYGPQGSAYIPSNGGAPVITAANPTGQPLSASDFQIPTTNRIDPVTGKPIVLRGGGKTGQLNPDVGFDPRPNGTGSGSLGGRVTTGPTSPALSYSADPSYGSLMKDFSASDFQTDPGYAFRLSEGQKALDRSAAARGGLFSGETLKANDQYNQNFASNEYQNAYNRYQNNRTTKYNFLSNAAGGGQIAANNLGNVGAQYASNIGNALQTGYGNAANARASGYIGAANSWNGAISGVGNAVNGYLQTRI